MTILQRLELINRNPQARIYFNQHSKINIDLIIDALKERIKGTTKDPSEYICEIYLVLSKHSLKEIISETEKYMKSINIFDCVLIEKPIEDGLTQDEIIKMLEFFKEDEELFPIEIESDNSSAMGFMTYTKAERIGYRYYKGDRFYKRIEDILSDIKLESENNIYDIPTEDDTTVHTYLTRNI